MKISATFSPTLPIRVSFLQQDITGAPKAWAIDPNLDGNVEFFGVTAEESGGCLVFSEENINCAADGGDVEISAERKGDQLVGNNAIRVIFGR